MKKTAVVYITLHGEQEVRTYNLTSKTQDDAFKVFLVDLIATHYERVTINFLD